MTRVRTVLRRPVSRAGASLLTVTLLAGVLVAAIGAGYTATRPLLGDGSAFLGKGHTVAHVNGETGRSDAEVAMQLATGTEELQPVRLPNGRLVIVNKTTGQVTYLDVATLDPDRAPETRKESAGKVEPVPTESDGYLVDRERNTVERIGPPEQPPPEPVPIPDGIVAAVPGGDSMWVLTTKGEIVEVAGGRRVRGLRLGAEPVGLTVADSHPVAVTEDGTVYVVDGERPRALGRLGVSGGDLKLGAWRGAGRFVVAVDTRTGRVAALDPRTERQLTVDLKVTPGRAELDAPVVLGTWAYVPDYSRPVLWRINLATGTADGKPLEVPGQPGAFELKVSGGRVWANNQYDRRVLVIGADGRERYADKGPGAELGDTEGQTGPPTGGGTPPGGTPPETPPDGEAPDGPPTGQEATTVTVPSFPRGTPYRQACATITELRLRCRPVAAGDGPGLRTGDVLGTDPAAGTRVAEGSRVVVRYVGPVRTPSVVGLPYEVACQTVKAAKLVCATKIDATPAVAPNQLGVVAAQSPAPNAAIAKGGTVTVTYPDSIALPRLADQMFDAACDRIRTIYRMKCVAQRGDAPPAAPQAGQVYQQDPPASTVARMDSTVTVRYYRGDSTLESYVGENVDAACARVRALGLECRSAEGATAWGTGRSPGEVYQQEFPPGAVRPVGTPVTLTYYCNCNDLPGLSGDIDQACGTVRSQGFQCNAVEAWHPSFRTVISQEPGPGRPELGSVVTLRYSPRRPVEYFIYRFGGADIWILRPAGQVPGGAETYRVGVGYAPDTPGQAHRIKEFECNAGGTGCMGLPINYFYSNIDAHEGYRVTINPVAVFMPCEVGGRAIYRLWNSGPPRYYKISENPNAFPGYTGVELLGCVW